MSIQQNISEAIENYNRKTFFTLRRVTALLFLISTFVWISIVAPNLDKLPSDFSFTSNIISIDNFYDIENSRFIGEEFSKTEYRYETIEASNDSLVVKNTFKVRTIEDAPIFGVERLYGIDRSTGAHLKTLGDKPRDGYLFAPKNLKKGNSFIYWHINYDGPATMNFVAEEQINGLKVFRYESFYEDLDIDQTEELSYLPDVGETLGINLDPHLQIWVEPSSGRLVKYQDETIAYYYDLESGERLYPWNKFSNTFDEESILKNVNTVRRERVQGRTINIYIPMILFGIAVLFSEITAIFRKKYSKYLQLEKIRILAGLVILMLSLIVFFSWVFNTDGIIRLGFAEGIRTNPLTAIMFMYLGLMICLNKKIQNKILILTTSIYMLVTFIRLMSIYDVIDFQIDQVLFRSRVLEADSRMAVFTTVGFLLIGIALIATHIKKFNKLRIVEISTISTLVLSTIITLQYIFEISNSASLPFFKYTSFNTSLLMIFVSTTILFTFRNRNDVVLGLFGNTFIFGILLLSILSSIGVATVIENITTDNALEDFRSEAAQATDSIEERLRIYINVLEGSRGLLSASDVVDRSEWKAYVDSLSIQNNYPGIQGIGYSIFVTPENKQAHIDSIRSEGFPEYTIKPEGERDLYTAIIYLEPFDIRNQEAFGFDMFQEITRNNAMVQARDTGLSRLSGRITLVQEIDEDVQPGFLIYVPFYGKDNLPNTVEERRENIIGYTYSPFRARDFVEETLGKGGLEDIALTVIDGVVDSVDNQLYDDSDNKIDKEKGEGRFKEKYTLYVGGRPWLLTFESTPDYGQTTFTIITPLVVIAVGTGVSLLITLITYTIISSRQKAISYAEEVTKDLKEAKAKDEAVLLSIGDGLVATDENGNIILVNDAFERLVGWKEEEVIGKLFIEVIPMLDKEGKVIDHEDRLMTHTLGNYQQEPNKLVDKLYQRKDGSTFPVSITVSPILVQGKIEGAVEVFRDITTEQRIDQAKTEFVSLASHQLRTPLTTISWYSEMLGDKDSGKLTKEQQEFRDEILTATKQMTELIESLLNVSRIELGTFAINPEPTDLMELLEGVINELKLMIKEKKLKIDIGKSDVPELSVDPKLFRIVYQNILTNAVKYTPEKGVITINHRVDDSKLLISIQDSGHGIPKDQQSEIFKKLFRADNVRQMDTKGTGLGLYITRSIVEQSGGKIWFESEEDKGTIFFIEMPLSGMKKKAGSKVLE